MLRQFEVEHYRSLRKVSIQPGRITVVTGPNGSGKSNLYQALRLLPAAAAGTLSTTLLAEGGMPSALWAGPRAQGPVRLRLTANLGGLTYELAAGLVPKWSDDTPFVLDPEIKEEFVYLGATRRRSTTMVDRAGATATLTDHNGERRQMVAALDPAESVMAQVNDPVTFPELDLVRRSFAAWRFYHHFDTTPTAPARHVQPGVRVNTLAPDGHNLAAMLATLDERGDLAPVTDAVAAAFPGYALFLDTANPGRFAVGLVAPGLLRPLSGAELSDGQLRFLCLAAALLSSRPPELLVLNEPETSLHPAAVTALAPLILQAAQFSQVWITTHSAELAARLAPDATTIELDISGGETIATTVT